MAIQYDTDEERRLHANVIHSLADQYHRDEAMIRELYEARLERLMSGARIKIYLSVLTARYVKNALQQSRDTYAGRGYVDHAH